MVLRTLFMHLLPIFLFFLLYVILCSVSLGLYHAICVLFHWACIMQTNVTSTFVFLIDDLFNFSDFVSLKNVLGFFWAHSLGISWLDAFLCSRLSSACHGELSIEYHMARKKIREWYRVGISVCIHVCCIKSWFCVKLRKLLEKVVDFWWTGNC